MADIETNSPSKIPLGKKFSKNHTYVIFGGENQAGKKGRKRERETKGGKENLNNHTAQVPMFQTTFSCIFFANIPTENHNCLVASYIISPRASI